VVPPRSDRVSRAPPYSRIKQALRIRGYHPLWPAFPCRSASTCLTTGLIRVRSPLLAESPLMSVPPGTEMFQFPGFASCTYVFNARYPKGVGCPIRTSRDQSLLAAPPGFSQRATSFIASWRQGIHQMPFSCSNPKPAPPKETPESTSQTHHAQEPSTPQTYRTRRTPNPTASQYASSLSTHIHAPERCSQAGNRTRRQRREPGQTPMPAQPRTHPHNPATRTTTMQEAKATRGVLRAQRRTRT